MARKALLVLVIVRCFAMCRPEEQEASVVGLGSLIQRLHHHPHSHPLPDVRPGTRTVTQESAPGGSELHHEVQRQLGANSDFARTDRGSWPSLPIFYQPYKAAGKAAKAVQNMDIGNYWKRWKNHMVALCNRAVLRPHEHLRNTTSGKCRDSRHCENQCQERCLLDNARQHCVADKCSKTCKVERGSCDERGRNCKYHCKDECLLHCIRSHLYELKHTIASCIAQPLKKCQNTCAAVAHSNPSKPKMFLSCHTRGVTEAMKDCIPSSMESCVSQCGQHVCLRGRCTCPGLISGGDECSSKPSDIMASVPPLTLQCFQNFQDPAFQKANEYLQGDAPASSVSFLNARTRSTMESFSQYQWYVSARGEEPGMKIIPDLQDMADWTSCALIGSSGSLTGQGMGEVIDTLHTAWIRFNDAPTEGFGDDVGTKTTLRIQNNLYCGFNEGKEEMCSPYTKFSTRAKCHPTEGRDCPLMIFSDQLHRVVHDFMQPEFFHSPEIDVNNYHRNTTGHVDTSAGFFGALLALHMCGEVSIYGFDQHPTHYYSKKPSATIKPFETRHGWDAEHRCLETYQARIPNFRIIEGHQLQQEKQRLKEKLQGQSL